jgi:hypothetical protein
VRFFLAVFAVFWGIFGVIFDTFLWVFGFLTRFDTFLWFLTLFGGFLAVFDTF